MKRIIIILLAAVLMLCMVACGGNGETNETGEMSKEELLAVAIELNIAKMREDVDSNKSKASLYTGNVYLVTAYIAEIETDYVSLDYSGSHVINIRAYLPTDVLINLTEGSRITIVGEMGKYDVEEKSIASGTYPYPYFEMRNVYFVNDIFEITGVADVDDYETFPNLASHEMNRFFRLIGNDGITYYVECALYEIGDGNVIIAEKTINSGESITITGRQYVHKTEIVTGYHGNVPIVSTEYIQAFKDVTLVE